MRHLSRSARAGFTLIEVLIVIAIILVLSGLIGVAVFQRRDEAKVSLTQTDMNTLKSAIMQFYEDFDRVPTEEEGLTVLWDQSQLDDPELEDKWSGYLNNKIPQDRWGYEWVYEEVNRTSCRIRSVGPDGEEETDDDIELEVTTGAFNAADDENGDFMDGGDDPFGEGGG